LLWFISDMGKFCQSGGMILDLWSKRTMMNLLEQGSRARSASLAVLALMLAGSAVPLTAQDTLAETRIRAMEAQIRALQRKVFPGDAKFFGPEVVAPSATASGTPAASAVGDLASRLESVEAQLKRLTAQAEENGNKLAQLEAKVNGTAPAATPTPSASPGPAATPAPTPTPTPTASTPDSNLSAMTGGASTPKPTPTPTPRPTASSGPSAQRLAAVRAIAKPQTQDPGDDEYSYGFRLWEAKFFPEAQQQLKLMIDRYPRHAKVSYARNLLGRAFLDDGKARDAATWFLQNYNANKSGDRAPDSLLFLAESMRQLKDVSRSCIALSEFSSSFPREAAGRLKSQYDATRGGVKCN
jgi:TolA-binding protein